MIKGPIIIVDDDKDAQEMYADNIKAIGICNEVKFFNTGQEALNYLYTTKEQPFIIISDVNMHAMDGIRFKEMIQGDDYLRDKGIPFVFISTNAGKDAVRKAHKLSVQGYFEKPNRIEEFQQILKILFGYWSVCKHINNT